MPAAGFEPAAPESKRQQTHVLDGATTRIGKITPYYIILSQSVYTLHTDLIFLTNTINIYNTRSYRKLSWLSSRFQISPKYPRTSTGFLFILLVIVL
jgi:hypothetical protein